MNRIEKQAKREFKKLPKETQKRINAMRRVPTARPGHVIDGKRYARKKHWSEEEL